ncbi:MAG: hypothetical protein OHK0046_34410 [Anaerolineae bacterium]
MAVENTVFISYRRANVFHARAIYQDLVSHGYDVFLDFEILNAGAYKPVILNHIKARAHFLVILTPSTLERCAEPNDWVRLEIETALAHKRSVVPLIFDGFDFQDAQPYLTGKLNLLLHYNALRIPSDFFEEAMQRLRTEYLSQDIALVMHPIPTAHQDTIEHEHVVLTSGPPVTLQQLQASVYFERGVAAEASNLDAKLTNYTRAIQLHPGYADAYNNRGVVHTHRGDLQQALRDFDAALRLDSNLPDAYNNRGNIYFALGQDQEALSDYHEALLRNPDFTDVLVNRGNLYLRRKQFDRAIEDYTAALEKNPVSAKAYLGRSSVYFAVDDRSRAAADLEQALATDPSYHRAHYMLGRLHMMNRNMDAAMKSFNKAIELKSNFTDAIVGRGMTHFENGHYDAAIQDYTLALAFAPDHVNAFINRGAAYSAQGQHRLALRDYESALQIDPQNSIARENHDIARQKSEDETTA